MRAESALSLYVKWLHQVEIGLILNNSYKGTTAMFVFLSNYITLESFVSSREYGRRAAFVDLKLEA